MFALMLEYQGVVLHRLKEFTTPEREVGTKKPLCGVRTICGSAVWLGVPEVWMQESIARRFREIHHIDGGTNLSYHGGRVRLYSLKCCSCEAGDDV